MNNNPISLAFNLTKTLSDTIENAVKTGVILAPEDKINTRMQICTDCKCFSHANSRCQLCGCFMNMKVRFDVSKCPANKW